VRSKRTPTVSIWVTQVQGQNIRRLLDSYVRDAQYGLVLADNGGPVFSYDPFGRRVNKTIMSTSTNFVYDGANAVQEYVTLLTAYLLTSRVDKHSTHREYFRKDHSGLHCSTEVLCCS
jgi:hypothetical protein